MANMWLAKWRLHRGIRYSRSSHHAKAHRNFALAARAGHPEAQYRLGLAYALGTGCPRSGMEALRWYQAAADGGQREAQFELGILLLNDHNAEWSAGISSRVASSTSSPTNLILRQLFPEGLTIRRDNEKAFYWLKKSAEAGKPEAQANLGWLLLKGVGCSIDVEAAKIWFQCASEHNLSQAALGLSEIFGSTESSCYDQMASKSWLKTAADLGNASASFQYAMKILEADRSENDLSAATEYLRLAVREGHREAAFQLGVLELSRAGDAFQADRAAEHLRIAAKAGHSGASLALAEFFSRGLKTRPDLAEAARWYRSAADSGNVAAQFQLGCFFARGEGVPRDLKHAIRYFESSAHGGHLVGALNAAIFYEKGDGVDKDMGRALKLFRIAAEGGLAQAQVRLAHLLMSGAAGRQEISLASTFLEKAAIQDNTDAEFLLAQLLINSRDFYDIDRAEVLLEHAIEKSHIPAIEFTLANASKLRSVQKLGSAAIEALEKLISAGSIRAMVLLAGELFSGRFISVDLAKGEQILIQAAKSGDPEANFQLGVFYCKRKLTDDDIKFGLEHYVRAADGGHIIAKYNAGVMLLSGKADEGNRRRALELLKEASSRGLSQADEILKQFPVDVASTTAQI